MAGMSDKIECADCGKSFHHTLIDAWLSPAKSDDADEADAHLCATCHGRRGPSAWGPWCALDGEPVLESPAS